MRDQLTKKNASERGIYVTKILALLKPQMRVLVIGCGTAHIIQALARGQSRLLFIGLDVSTAMLDVASDNTADLPNIGLVQGDGHRLPFAACSLDVIITPLANYSTQEAYRVLRTQGVFVEYGLGPQADKEIREFFPKRIEKENFYFPKSLKRWKQEAWKLPSTQASPSLV